MIAMAPTYASCDHPNGFGLSQLAYVGAIAIMYTVLDRKSTRLNSSHLVISYAVFSLKKYRRSKLGTFAVSTLAPLQSGPLTLLTQSCAMCTSVLRALADPRLTVPCLLSFANQTGLGSS